MSLSEDTTWRRAYPTGAECSIWTQAQRGKWATRSPTAVATRPVAAVLARGSNATQNWPASSFATTIVTWWWIAKRWSSRRTRKGINRPFDWHQLAAMVVACHLWSYNGLLLIPNLLILAVITTTRVDASVNRICSSSKGQWKARQHRKGHRSASRTVNRSHQQVEHHRVGHRLAVRQIEQRAELVERRVRQAARQRVERRIDQQPAERLRIERLLVRHRELSPRSLLHNG